MFQINFYIPIEQEDQISDILMESGATSISVQPGEKKISLTALFEDISLLKTKLPHEDYTVRQLTEDEWKNSWTQYCKPIEINRDIIILPHTEEDIPGSHRYRINIDPRDAFGDGSHPTTILCLEEIYSLLSEIPDNIREKMTVLDIGTGTGVLAILCELMGVRSIDAVDNDKHAITRTRENIKLNRCKHIASFQGDIIKSTLTRKYNLVIANLLTGIIEESLEKIEYCSASDGTIIMSGISDLWAEDMKQKFSDNGFTLLHHRTLKGWNSFSLKKQEA